MNIPISLNPSPVFEATVEIRFESNFPPDTIVGIIYSKYFDKQIQLEGLPVLQIPPELRRQDPNFRYKPTHKFMLGEYTVQIGGDVILLISPISYPGWENYKAVLNDLLDKLRNINLIRQVDYLSLKYLSFFKDANIFDHIRLNICFNEEKVNHPSTAFRTEFNDENYVNILQVLNNVHVKNSVTDSDGSLIEIICVAPKDSLGMDKIGAIIDRAHQKEKELFFSLVDEGYLQEFNPVY